MRRIAVTGLGLVTPLGTGVETVWESLLAGRSGFAPVSSFDTSAHTAHLGAEIPDFQPEPWFRNLAPGSVSRASQLAVAAARLALADAGLESLGFNTERAGVSMGTTSGEPREIERLDDDLLAGDRERAGVGFADRYPSHVLASHVAAELGLGGMVTVIPNACAAGSYALAHAADQLRAGRAEVMLAGGADAFSRITYTGFARLGAVAPDTVRPFDRNRKGMIPGEGAAILVLEPWERATGRGARIYAELLSWGFSCDAHHMTAAHPEGAGAVRAMEQALARGGVGAEAVSYVSAHGTGTPTNDKLETLAFQRVFGSRSRRVPTSSIKSMLGHTMGAASAIESAVCALAVHTDRVPPTTNFETPDPDCDLDCVPNTARELRVELAMNNAYAFGGNNASVLFRKVG
jgi:3-oxoacyl-[acyl-carrier-protein] synthase II